MKTDYENAKIVHIEWVDSSRNSGWRAVEAALVEDLKCKTVGWLIDESEEAVTIAASVASPYCSSCDPCTIPWCAITKYEELVP